MSSKVKTSKVDALAHHGLFQLIVCETLESDLPQLPWEDFLEMNESYIHALQEENKAKTPVKTVRKKKKVEKEGPSIKHKTQKRNRLEESDEEAVYTFMKLGTPDTNPLKLKGKSSSFEKKFKTPPRRTRTRSQSSKKLQITTPISITLKRDEYT